jgi:hypothetical protein
VVRPAAATCLMLGLHLEYFFMYMFSGSDGVFPPFLVFSALCRFSVSFGENKLRDFFTQEKTRGCTDFLP